MLVPVWNGLLDLLAPPRCAACDLLLDARLPGFCDGCFVLLEPALYASSSEHDLDAYLYGGPLRDALHRLKYEGRSELAPALAALLREASTRLLGQVELVCSVPLHPRRLRQRGYNQSALLAGPLARSLGVPCAPTLLRRLRDTEAQVGKTRAERQAQLRGAFVAAPRGRGRVVLVLDDVRTTGATFEEARRALLAAGAERVFTLALACAPADESE